MGLKDFFRIGGGDKNPAVVSAGAGENTSSSVDPVKSTKKTFDTDVIDQRLPEQLGMLFSDEFSDLNVPNLKFYEDAARRGMFYFASNLYDTIAQRDLRFGGLLQKRGLAVHTKTFTVKCDDWDEGKKFADELLAEMGDVYEFFAQIVRGGLKGMRTFEINYKLKNGKIMIDTITHIEDHLNLYDENTNTCHILNTAGVKLSELRSWANEGMFDKLAFDKLPKQECAPEKIIRVYSFDGDSKNPFLNGIVFGVILTYFLKIHTVKSEHIYLERLSFPIVKAGYDSLNDKTKSQATNIAKNVKGKSWVVLPKEITLDYMNDESKGTTANIFQQNVAYHNKELTIRVMGESETTDMGKNGARSALEVKQQISADITVGDLKLITKTMRDVFKNVFSLNFANIPNLPEIEFLELKSLNDKKLQAEIIEVLYNAGYEVDEKTVEELMDMTIKKIEGEINPPPVKDLKGSLITDAYVISSIDKMIRTILES